MATHLLAAFPVSDLKIEHLQSLVTLQVEEDETLEFKQELRLGTDKEKREVCKDVSALSNTLGGFLIYGIGEDSSRAHSIDGLDFSPEEEQRLTQVITSGISPRLQLFEIRKIPLAANKVVVVIHVRSDGQLRQVQYDDKRFYKRVGKITIVMEPSDVTAFAGASKPESRDSEIIHQRREFESRVKGGTFHGVKAKNGILTVGILPRHIPPNVNFTDPQVELLRELVPIYCGGWDRQFRGSSFITFATSYRDREPYAATELNENGTITAANSAILSNEGYFKVQLPEGAYGYVPSIALEREIITSVHRYLSLLWNLRVAGPWDVGISLLNVRGYIMSVSVRVQDRQHGCIFPDDDIIAPFVTFASDVDAKDPQTVAKKLKQPFDFIWREFNFPGSYNYDNDGNWSESRQY